MVRHGVSVFAPVQRHHKTYDIVYALWFIKRRYVYQKDAVKAPVVL